MFFVGWIEFGDVQVLEEVRGGESFAAYLRIRFCGESYGCGIYKRADKMRFEGIVERYESYGFMREKWLVVYRG